MMEASTIPMMTKHNLSRKSQPTKHKSDPNTLNFEKNLNNDSLLTGTVTRITKKSPETHIVKR